MGDIISNLMRLMSEIKAAELALTPN